MKRGSLLLLTSLMLLSLAGLVAVQGYWVRSSVHLKEQEFARSVNGALNQAVMNLEAQNKVSWLRKEVVLGDSVKKLVIVNGDTLEADDLPPEELSVRSPQGSADIRHEEVLIQSEKEGNQAKVMVHVTDQSTVIMRDEKLEGDSMRVSVMPQAELFQQLLADLAKDPQPIRQRVDSLRLHKAVQQALAQVDIAEPFRLGVTERPGQPFVLPLLPADSLPDTLGAFSVRLFPSSLRKEPAQLWIDFPAHRSSLSQVLRIVLPTTGVLILVVAGVFAFTVSAWRKQKRLSEMKTEFINNMTHELKTPVATISLATEALQDPDMLQDSKAVLRYAQMIREENDRLKAHIERALENARLEKGQMVLQLERLSLNEAVQAQIARIQPKMAARNGVISVETTSHTYVKADQHYLGDILHNLLDNAEKYSPNSPRIELKITSAKGFAELSIIDQGVGIAPAHLARIFDPFYRVPTGNTHDVKGTGLGLSYSRSLARLMGGDLVASSTLGKGSTFVLRLPLHPEGGAA
jgi:two-component system phosphate regulon sensor histidine kinase PhoR